MTPDLTAALGLLVERGERPPCADGSGAWLDEDRETRAIAATLCVECPILRECGQAADTARDAFGVWGGRDRTQRAGSKARAS